MTKLYSTYADLYHKMYQSFIDYDAEFAFYHQLVKQTGASSVLEIGCGTGQLAKRFVDHGYAYAGIDVSSEMLQYAFATLPRHYFRQMDMRAIDLPSTFDAVLITARSISYLLTNDDVMKTLAGIRKVCRAGGALIFDFIDAERFIPSITQELVTHEVVVDGTSYKRQSRFRRNLRHHWNWYWDSTFFVHENDRYRKIGTDKAQLRAFTEDELTTFLKLHGFARQSVIDRKTYAFDTKVMQAVVAM